MKIRRIICATMALTLLCSSSGFAQWNDERYPGEHRDRGYHESYHHDNGRHLGQHKHHHRHWSRGERVPDQYRHRQYVIADWDARHYKRPPRGYHYVRTDDGDVLLVAITTGIIASIILNQN